MVIYINEAEFLITLFREYKEKLYVAMRKDNYPMEQILRFINGYSIICDACYEEYMDVITNSGCNINLSIGEVFCDGCHEALGILLEIVDECIPAFHNAGKWERIGMMYASCLAKYYIKNVIFGNDTEVEGGLYMDIPDKDDPDSYDWEEHELWEIYKI